LGEETCVITATRFGMVKKSLVTELPGPSSQTFNLVRVNEGDRLGWVGLTDGKTSSAKGKKEIFLVTSTGMAIRFKEDDVRPMGLVAAGVNGIKLADKDEVVGMEILPADGDIFLLTNDGKAKRVDVKEFPIQGRYGKGVVAWDLPNKSTLVAIASGKPNVMATIHISKGAPKSTRLDAAGLRKRAASKGDHVVDVKPGETITSINVGWMVERYIKLAEEKPTPKKTAPAKKAGKSPAKKVAKPAPKKGKKVSKPAKKAKAKPAKKKKKK
jgi:DNA gyrase subunit A